MNDQMPTLNAPKPDGNPPPGASAIPADLRIADWIDTSDPDPELGPDPTATVGAVRQSLGDYRATECLDYWTWPPAVFVGADGRRYAAEINVVVRPVTPDEVRAAVEGAKGYECDMRADRIKDLDGYLGAPGV